MRELSLSLQSVSAGMITEAEIRIVDMYNAVHSLLYRMILYNTPHESILRNRYYRKLNRDADSR